MTDAAIRVTVEFEHGSICYRARGTFGPKDLRIERDLGNGWELIDNPVVPLKLLAIECLQRSLRETSGPPYLDVALRDAMDRMHAAEARAAEYAAILQDVQDLVDEGGASEPCEKQLRAILAGKGGP